MQDNFREVDQNGFCGLQKVLSSRSNFSNFSRLSQTFFQINTKISLNQFKNFPVSGNTGDHKYSRSDNSPKKILLKTLLNVFHNFTKQSSYKRLISLDQTISRKSTIIIKNLRSKSVSLTPKSELKIGQRKKQQTTNNCSTLLARV